MAELNAFVAGARCRVAGAQAGPLLGLTFAVKDLIDVAGWPTGGGNPDWARAHAVPQLHAWVVATLLAAGASVIGKTITDEVSLGILGENPHDGTPLNPRAPERVLGGSSSGSASAVAGGSCDFALGTDTGGSVRVPASFSGLFGIRPRAQRTLQGSEAAQTFRAWLDQYNPRLAFNVARGLVLGAMIPEAERGAAALVRLEARAQVRRLLPPGSILCLPTTPFPAPKRGLAVSELDFPRSRISCLTCIGGLTGAPQVNLPGAMVDGAPVGLPIVGPHGADLELLAVAKTFA